MLDHPLRQQRNEAFSVEPGFCAVVISLWKVPDLGDLLEPLKDQFDLPSVPISFEHLADREGLLWKSREKYDILGELKGFRLELLAVFLGTPPKFRLCCLYGQFALSECTYPTFRERSPCIPQQSHEIEHLSSFAKGNHPFQKAERLSILAKDLHPIRINTHAHMGTLPHDMAYAGTLRVASVGNDVVSGFDGELDERIPVPFAASRSQFEEVASQRRDAIGSLSGQVP
jgi:hypothetical protein